MAEFVAWINGRYPYVWRLRRYLGDRHGQRCRIIARAKGILPCRNICVEFPDGFVVITSRWAVRRAT